MKRFNTIWLILILTPMGFSQSVAYHSIFEKSVFEEDHDKPLKILLAADASITPDKYTQIEREIETWVESLNTLRAKVQNDEIFIEKMFLKIHRKQLGWYDSYVQFSDVFLKREYDCLTGTALFAVILERLGFSFTILEFDFHTFLLVDVNKRLILLEATDPLSGVVTSADEIESRINKYKTSDYVSDKITKSNSYKEISLYELCGLQYFNMAISSFNHQQFAEAFQLISKAELIYPSARIHETRLLISSNTQSENN